MPILSTFLGEVSDVEAFKLFRKWIHCILRTCQFNRRNHIAGKIDFSDSIISNWKQTVRRFICLEIFISLNTINSEEGSPCRKRLQLTMSRTWFTHPLQKVFSTINNETNPRFYTQMPLTLACRRRFSLPLWHYYRGIIL